LTTIAGAASIAVAYRAPWAFTRMVATAGMPVYSLRPDAAVLAYLGTAVLLTACLAGLSPAAESLRVNLAAAMKMGEGWSGTGRGASRSHGFLVAAQVAMSLVLLVTAGLFLRGQWRAFTADPGFETQHVLMVQIHGSAALALGLRSVPSVQVVAAGSPFAEDESLGESRVVHVPHLGGQERKSAVISLVSPEFFSALSIPISRGRVFGGETEAVVSEALARSFWPGEDPVGRRLMLQDGTSLQVAGVAHDLRSEHVGPTDAPHIYRFAGPHMLPGTLMVRFAGAVEPVERGIREAMKRFDVESSTPPKTLRAILHENAERMSTIVRMVVILALTALLLAVLGIYGVVALAASRRTRELGIRMALGASKPAVVGAVLSSGLRPIAWGVGVGLVMAVMAARATAVVLLRTPIPIAANDPVVYLSVGLLLAGVGVAAMLTPAVRAARADPMQALRQD
jgi:predicted permease